MALAVAALLSVSLVALRALSLEPGSEQIAELLAAHVVALRALSDRQASPVSDGATSSTALEVLHAARPPAQAGRPWLPFARRLADSLQRRLGDGTQVLTEEGDAPRLWVSPARPGAAWLGFRIPAFRTQAMHLSAVVLVAALLIVLATAWWLRLELVRPLRALSDQAPALASGELEAPPLPDGAASELQELAEALHRAGLEARSASRERELLLAGLSHDLRTPLARLSYALELLRGEDAALLADMRADIEELDALIGALLQRARDAHAEPERDINLPALIRQAIGSAQSGDWQLEGADPMILRGRPLTLRRIFDNLIGNASRHAQPPFACRWRMARGEFVCEIEDAGPGLPPAILARLAAPAADMGVESAGDGQAESGPWERQPSGAMSSEPIQPDPLPSGSSLSGLGLTVVRHLLAGVGGRLEAGESPLGGTRMRVSWPIPHLR